MKNTLLLENSVNFMTNKIFKRNINKMSDSIGDLIEYLYDCGYIKHTNSLRIIGEYRYRGSYDIKTFSVYAKHYNLIYESNVSICMNNTCRRII